MFAIGDCGTIEMKKLMSDVTDLFEKADVNKDGSLSMDEFRGNFLIFSLPMFLNRFAKLVKCLYVSRYLYIFIFVYCQPEVLLNNTEQLTVKHL